MGKAGIILAVLAALVSSAAAAGPSVERGKELFESRQLGTNGKSCASCHPGGKKLEKAATYDEGELREIVNQCIQNPLRGKALDPASAEMKSLILYIRTFAK
jgi:hypothetical protein